MRPLLITTRTALAEAWANRSAFWTQVSAIILNDIVWIVFWLLFFRRVGPMRGWDSDSVLVLLAILATSCGFTFGILANCRRIGMLAADGDLDAALSLPVSPLAYLLVRRIETVHLGDIGFGIALFLAVGAPTPGRVAMFVFGVAVAVVVVAGFLVLTGSMAFFTGRTEVGDMGFHAMMILSSYPVDIFVGASKVLLYSVVPAAFVAAVPARLVNDPSLSDALALIAAAAVFGVAGWTAFTLGLRRYTSGAAWTRA
jgi:ABC-2 type transport system permease protein